MIYKEILFFSITLKSLSSRKAELNFPMGRGCQTSVLEGLPGDLPPLHKARREKDCLCMARH
uniref:Uncharacterized protein n=1 Tax=Anguilla anguilla TaxID=7936 RepID=A0A0E9SIU6_ANGAN